MAKNPAFLFYSNDYFEGTRTMLPEERACYVDLMVYQHQHDYIPNDIKRIMMYCVGVSEATLIATLEAKFKLCEKGWYNEKLQEVMDRREEYVQHQSDNGTYGQFIKKMNKDKSIKNLTELKDFIENSYSKKRLIEDLKKNNDYETNLKALREALLKHSENENENENEDDIEVGLTKTSNKSNGVKNSKNSKKLIIPTESEQQMFDQARKFYLGSKRGLKTEFDNFVKKYPTEWRNILPLLLPAILREKVDKEQKLKNNGFNQQWKNFSTWINGRCWEIEYPNVSEKEVNELGISVTTNESGEQKVEVKQDRSSFPLYSSMQVMPHVYPEGTESRCGYYVIKNKKCVRTKKY